jgi:hypothetical protein
MHQRKRSGLPDVIAAPARRMKVLTARLTGASRSFEGVLDRQAHVTEREVD